MTEHLKMANLGYNYIFFVDLSNKELLNNVGCRS